MLNLPPKITALSIAQPKEHNKNLGATRSQTLEGLTSVICPTSDFPKSRQVSRVKIIRFIRNTNQAYGLARPAPTEGRIMIVTNVARDAMDALAAPDERSQCGRRSRVVLIPRRWNQARE